MAIGVEHDPGGEAARIRVQGDLDRRQAPHLARAVRDVLRAPGDARQIVLDVAGMARLDSAGAATLLQASQLCAGAGVALRLEALSAQHREALAALPRPSPAPPVDVVRTSVRERLGHRGHEAWRSLAEGVSLVQDALRALVGVLMGRQRLPRGALVQLSITYGVDALPILSLLSFLLGAILAFQASHQLRQFGATIYAVDLVAISMVREFSPMVTGIILSGRSGGAIAAELGSMKVQQELDALRTMGVDPVRHLVVPRLLALVLTQPALTVLADMMGILGGLVICAGLLDVPTQVFVARSFDVVQLDDLLHGLYKSLVFALLVGFTGCFWGVGAGRDAAAVGRAATRAVVAGIFSIIVVDSLFALVNTLSS